MTTSRFLCALRLLKVGAILIEVFALSMFMVWLVFTIIELAVPAPTTDAQQKNHSVVMNMTWIFFYIWNGLFLGGVLLGFVVIQLYRQNAKALVKVVHEEERRPWAIQRQVGMRVMKIVDELLINNESRIIVNDHLLFDHFTATQMSCAARCATATKCEHKNAVEIALRDPEMGRILSEDGGGRDPMFVGAR